LQGIPKQEKNKKKKDIESKTRCIIISHRKWTLQIEIHCSAAAALPADVCTAAPAVAVVVVAAAPDGAVQKGMLMDS